MSLTPLTALSPVDGRYAARCAELRDIFSEQGLIRARVRVEIAWLHALAAEREIVELRGLTAADLAVAQQVADGFSSADAATVIADGLSLIAEGPDIRHNELYALGLRAQADLAEIARARRVPDAAAIAVGVNP